MKLRIALLAATSLTAAAAANAATGWYMGIGAGWNWLPDGDYRITGNGVGVGKDEYETGYVAMGNVGYDWGRWRAEFEVGYRQNDLDCFTTGGSQCSLTSTNQGVWTLSQMVNVLYDIPISGRLSASVGAGVGGVLVVADQNVVDSFDSHTIDDYVVAGQLIAQLAYDLSDRWQVYADYHYILADDPQANFFSGKWGAASANWENSNHSLMLGLRFDLQRDGAAPMPPKPPEPPVTPKGPKQFIVFFGFNKSNLTPEAERVVSDAAAAAKQFGSASIMVVGHTDTVGSNKYNDALSMRRSAAVKSSLVSKGIAANAISTAGRGESELMVQTGDGVKEPQNRRATIDLN